MAADEYRVEIDLDDEAHGHPFSERLAALDFDDDVAARLGSRVIVTRDGARIFVYTESPEAAAEAERVVKEVLLEDGVHGAVAVRRWNPGTREWQDPAAPLEAGGAPGYEREVEEEGVPHPLFVFIEGHEPRFMRDLGI